MGLGSGGSGSSGGQANDGGAGPGGMGNAGDNGMGDGGAHGGYYGRTQAQNAARGRANKRDALQEKIAASKQLAKDRRVAKATADKTKADYVKRMNRLNGLFGTQLSYNPGTNTFSTKSFGQKVGDLIGGMVPGLSVDTKTARGEDFKAGKTKTDIDFGIGKFVGDVAGAMFGGPLGSNIAGLIGDEADNSIGRVDVDKSWDTGTMVASAAASPASPSTPSSGTTVAGKGGTARTGLLPASRAVEQAKATEVKPTGLLSAASMASLGNQQPGGGVAMNRYSFDPNLGRIVRV